jgi:uncharacterized protein (TIGR03083 family)
MSKLRPGALEDAVRSAADAVASTVAGAGSLSGNVRRSEWTAADAAAHLAVTQSIFADLVAGGSHPFEGFEPQGYSAVNARLLAENPTRDGPSLAESIRAGTDRFLAVASAARDAGESYESPLGRMNLETLLSYCLCHLLMHGEGIATAVGATSPVEPRHVPLAMPFLEHSVPFAYAMRTADAVNGAIEFRLRGGTRFWMNFTAHSAALSYECPGSVDCHVWSDARAFLLVALDHQTPLGSMVRGRAFAWGRRPWFALRLRGLLPGL